MSDEPKYLELPPFDDRLCDSGAMHEQYVIAVRNRSLKLRRFIKPLPFALAKVYTWRQLIDMLPQR